VGYYQNLGGKVSLFKAVKGKTVLFQISGKGKENHHRRMQVSKLEGGVSEGTRDWGTTHT